MLELGEWRLVPSPAGDGDLFLCAGADGALAVIPGGQRLPPSETAPSASGWRAARWLVGPDGPPSIDIDRPAVVVPLETVDVLGMLPEGMREEVLDIMLAQRRLAEALYLPEPGKPLDETAAATQARAMKWVRDQLAGCFTAGDAVTIPATAEQLLACLPATAHLRSGPLTVPATADQLLDRIPAPPPRIRPRPEWRSPPRPSTWKVRLLTWVVSLVPGRTLREVLPPVEADIEVAATDRVLLLSR